jgi:hypothetical protein
LVLLEPPALAIPRWDMAMSPVFGQAGYTMTQRQADSMIYSKSYRALSSGSLIAALFFWPLLFFGPKRASTLLVSFEPYGSGTMVKISGSAPLKSQRWLDGLAAETNDRALAATQVEA